jgi:PadR family transcriptional regulator AphA
MALKNRSMYAILGILSIRPSTGYDIKKYSDQVLAGFWNENFGHIYPTLKKMLESGMIETVSQEVNDKKRLYKITEKGKQELHLWLLENTAPQPVRSEFMLKIMFSNSLPADKVIHMLENYKTSHKDSLKKYSQMQEELDQGIQEISKERYLYINAVLRRGILSDKAVIQWCDETIRAVRQTAENESC